MGHIAQCSGCARFWEELKAAQEIVLGLPQAKVGSHFRDDVWQRIQSGEGAPDTIAQEPVPVLTKVRYGLLGAAAAAAFIVAVHYSVGSSPVIQEPPEVEIANDTTNGTELPVVPRPSATPAVADLTPANLAVTTAERVSQAARSLRNRSKNLTNISDFQPEVMRDVRQQIATVQNGLVILKQLRKEFGIEFRDREARDCETRVLTTLEMNSKLERPEQVMATLNAMTGCSLDRLHEKLLFSWRSNIPDERFLRSFVRQHEREIRLFVRIVPMPPGQPGEIRVFRPSEQPGEVRVFRMIRIVPPPAGPEKQPEKTDLPKRKTEPPKLRERSRHR